MATKALDLQMAKLEKDIEYTRERVSQIEVKIDIFHTKFDAFALEYQSEFVRKEEFVFWRNLIVSGLVTTIAVGVIMILIKK